MTLGDKLRVRREYMGLTQEQVAEFINISRTAYMSYEQDKTIPTYDVIEKFVILFKLNDKRDTVVFDEIDTTPVSVFNAPETEYNAGIVRDNLVLSGDEAIVIKYLRGLSAEEQTDFVNKIKDAYLDLLCVLPEE